MAAPTNLQPPPAGAAAHDQYIVTATNSGSAPTNGTKIVVTDIMPPGVTAINSSSAKPSITDDTGNSGNSVSCLVSPGGSKVTCNDLEPAPLQIGQRIVITIPVTVATTGTVTNSVTVTGGGGLHASASESAKIGLQNPPFGIHGTDCTTPNHPIRTCSFDGLVTNGDGSADTQAGSHPYAATTGFDVNSRFDSQGNVIPVASVKDIAVALPPGLVGDPTATPTCTQEELLSGFLATCPISAQVGIETVIETGGVLREPIYNMVPPPGLPAQFGFRVLTTAVFIDASVRTGGDYGLTASLRNIPAGYSLLGSITTFWGTPADPSHDSQRCDDNGLVFSGTCSTPHSFQAAPRPFLTLPTSCAGPQTTTMSVDSWQQPGQFQTASFVSHDTSGKRAGTSGCGLLDFSPTITVQPTVSSADAPSGLTVDLHIPQNDSPIGLAEANLENTVVTLPVGLSVSPSAAAGLGACSPAEIGLDNANQPTCPDASKVGSVEVDTPLLPTPLTGSVFLAQQNDNPFRSLLALYLVAQGDGVLVKLAGHVMPDPITGQLTTIFENNPQLPFSDFKLTFFGGPRGALATPDSCGMFTTTTSLSPWSGTAPATPSDSFMITGNCVNGFSPSFVAGMQNAQAGSNSPFVLSFSRSDRDQELSGLTVTLPPGMLAKLAGVALCSNAQLARAAANSGTAEQADPSCPGGSQVGIVESGAGPGSDPFFLTGRVYLTGPYKGAPYGLAVVVPALAGPFDLGTVVVRQALYVDPSTAQVTAVSDPFPTILDGIPLRIRRVDVILNRPDFTVNPTSCDPMSVTGTLTSAQGAVAGLSSRFQVGGCQELPFSPSLKMILSGRGKTRSGRHPTLTSILTQLPGQANIRSAQVTLPLSLALDPNNSQHVCDYDTAQAVHGGAVGCPADTIVGQATAVTPLLDQPLSGNVYLVQGIRLNARGQRIRTLPTLLIPLRGQIALDLRANSSVNGAGQLVTTFSTIPDAPVSKFMLTLTGGRKGLLVITGRGLNICKARQVTRAKLGAQSGKQESESITMSTPCRHVSRSHHRRDSRRGRRLASVRSSIRP